MRRLTVAFEDAGAVALEGELPGLIVYQRALIEHEIAAPCQRHQAFAGQRGAGPDHDLGLQADEAFFLGDLGMRKDEVDAAAPLVDQNHRFVLFAEGLVDDEVLEERVIDGNRQFDNLGAGRGNAEEEDQRGEQREYEQIPEMAGHDCSLLGGIVAGGSPN